MIHGVDIRHYSANELRAYFGVVPQETRMPKRNDGVKAWQEHSDDERRVFTRLQSAFAGMLDHADQHLARLVAFLDKAGVRDNTLVIVMSDNGASQEGGPLGFINAMGPFNFRPEPMAEKLRRIDDIGGPDTHTNFPHGWAMASNTPLRRYKQNTHGGGIRDPFVMCWPNRIKARGELRHQFIHACDLVPTLLELIDVEAPAGIAGVPQMPIEGVSFAPSIANPSAPSKGSAQYFEMFGHRGLWKDGWKAVAFHPVNTDFEEDQWELYHLDEDFSETEDLADAEPERLEALKTEWWKAAKAHNILPLDDRFGLRFLDSANRNRRQSFVFHRGVGHVPTDAAPDVRGRSYLIEADTLVKDGDSGVLIAHGDATSGYALFLRDGRLVYDLNIGGEHQVLVSDRPVPAGDHVLSLLMRQEGPKKTVSMAIDGEVCGRFQPQHGFFALIAWSGLDIGRDRGSPVSDYEAPFAFTGLLRKVTVTMDPDQTLDWEAAGAAEMARQ